jgi:hypothetical protein
MAAARTVRHLHLAAPSEAAVRRLLPTLEDALRCASLGDDGPRLMVVRRLALGRVSAGISSQALSRLIEQRTAQAGVAWVEAESPGAEAAPCVAFPSVLQARTRLALRLLGGLSCEAWYWPLAVPEFTRGSDSAANLRRIAWAVAMTPEARAALPAWTNAIVRELGARPLAACIVAAEGEALVQRAGIAVRMPGDMRIVERHEGGPQSDDTAPVTGRDLRGVDSSSRAASPLPAWLEALCSEATAAQLVRRAAATPTPSAPAARPVSRLLPLVAANELAAEPANIELFRPPDTITARTARTMSPSGPGFQSAEASAAAPRSPQAHDDATVPRVIAESITDSDGDPEPWLHPTAFGGLLFLLPLMQRLGLPTWLPPDDTCFAALVLRAALQRLRAPEDDPAWQLAGADAIAQPYRIAAPAAWQDPLLAAPRGRASPIDRLQQGAHPMEQAQAWLTAARYWLRRAGRIGLASLVRRPGRLALSATHADLHFELARTDLRVRRLGLDFDPGWLPWYGRVVSFHYRSRA